MSELVSPGIFNLDVPVLTAMSSHIETTYNISGFSAMGVVGLLAEHLLHPQYEIDNPGDLTYLLQRFVDNLDDKWVTELVTEHRKMMLEQGLNVDYMESDKRN